MKLEGNFYALLIIICICTVIVTLGVLYFYNQRVEMYVENGYIKKTVPGHDYPVWTKDYTYERKVLKY